MSISSSTINSLITYRNSEEGTSPDLGRQILVEVGLIALVPFALVEAAIMNIARIFTCFLSSQASSKVRTWASESTQAFFYGLKALLTNLFCQTVSLTPVKNPGNGYNAKRISKVFEQMDERLPHPTPEQLQVLKEVTLPTFLPGFDAGLIQYKLEAGNSEWRDRTIRMIWAIFEKIPQLDADEVEVIRELMLQAFSNCSNRMSTEVERMYYKYVERDLIYLYETGLSAEECLVYELTQYRMDLRDLAINTECDDEHNASSHNYFRRELNESVFYVPPAPLSGQDDHYLRCAMKEKRDAVISTFNRLYSSEAIISFVEEMVTDTGKKKVYKFKPAMFVEWLQKTNRMNEDAFVDDSMLKYKRSLIRTYLEENNFLTSLESENPSPENRPVILPPTADEPNDADFAPPPRLF